MYGALAPVQSGALEKARLTPPRGERGGQIDMTSEHQATAGNNEEQESLVDELRPGTKLLHGQYEITEFLNNGGFGITYLAKDSLQRTVVIKECFPGAFSRRSATLVRARSRAHTAELKSVVKLFINEARNLSVLQHPNIVGVHQVFEDNETAYMAIDFIDGSDLLDLIDDKSVTFTPDDIVRITKKLISAVGYIHLNNMLHRDISPDNVLINPDGDPVLIDFGAARVQASKQSRTLTALRVVKDGYSPQEFYIAGSEQGAWSDLYALGATLYHLITGDTPVNGQERLAALAEGRPDPQPKLVDLVTGYPNGFLATIDAAMKTLPKERIQSAEEWLDLIKSASPHMVSEYTGTAAAAAPADGAAGVDLTDVVKSVVETANTAPQPSNTDVPPSADARSVDTRSADTRSADARGVDEAAKKTSKANGLVRAVAAVVTLSAVGGVVIETMGPSFGIHGGVMGMITGQKPDIDNTADDSATGNGVEQVTAQAVSETQPATATVADAVSTAGDNSEPATSETATSEPATPDPATPEPATPEPATEVASTTTATQADIDLSDSQIKAAQWAVRLPFDAVSGRSNDTHFALIKKISDEQRAEIVDDWVGIKVAVYSVNGFRLPRQADLAKEILAHATDFTTGEITVDVRYKSAGSNKFLNGSLSVPVERRLEMTNGVRTTVRQIDGQWRPVVTRHGDSNLQVGDIIVSEQSTGQKMQNPEDLETVVQSMATLGNSTVTLIVLRDGSRQSVVLPLTTRSDG
jgi:serine/threonine protein kinase